MLYGRHVERSAILALLDRARDSSESAVLVVRGEPGVGKSALLADAAESATDMRVLRALGVETESELAFAGLHQVVWPLLDRLDEIPAPQAEALRGALGLAAAQEHDRLLVAAAVLSLLAAAAEETPLLCVVDDAQWLDVASSDALTFAARRLRAESIVLLFAAREGDERVFEGRGLPELYLHELDAAASRELLKEQGRQAFADDVLERVLEVAGGNPLALLELPRALTAEQRAGTEQLTDPLPLSTNVEDAFLARARRLPRPSQLLLVLAAADGAGDPAVVLTGARALGIDEEAFAAAESSRLLRVTERAVEFRHPLVRSAVYQAASLSERRAVHTILAETLPEGDDRRVWHRAAATIGADEEVAAELEITAERARKRSGYAAAAAALERAAALTDDDETTARRLARAAEAAWFAGHPTRATALLSAARRLTEDSVLLSEIDYHEALMEMQCGDPRKANALVVTAVERLAPVAPERAASMIVAGGEAAAFAGDMEAEADAGRRAAALQEQLSEERFELTMQHGIWRLLDGDLAEATPLLRRAIELAADSENPRRLSWAGSCAGYMLDMGLARSFFERAAAEARDEGAIATLALALQMVAHVDAVAGRFAGAAAAASEGLPLALATGQENGACHMRAATAWALGVLGKEEECRAGAAEVLELATARGLGLQAALARIALAELELGLGRAAEAVTQFETLRAAGPGASHDAMKMIAVPSFVEANVRAGAPVDRSVIVPYELWVTSFDAASELPLLERARGLLASGDDALAHFQAALELHRPVARPFDQGRTELLYGEALRRGKRRREAREHLRAAHELFEQVGAAGWAARARAELRATGETARRRDPSTLNQLTPQELQIARYVAEGRTNKEVAAALFLSPRTIDAHLRSVFAKLEITSRTQLSVLVAGQDNTVSEAAISPMRA